jgi:tetratricopeptide (TPR) repeat protein
MKILKSIILLSLMIATTFAAVDTSDYAIGLAALIKGDIQTAKSRLAAAYKKNSANPFIQMAYAQIAPCSTAVLLFKTIGETQTAPDSLRAAAYKQLGDYHYASSDYLKAIDNYRYASKYGNKPMYKHYWALCSYASGDTVSAKSLWHTLTLEHGDTIAEIANYHLGLMFTKQKAWQEAFSCFDKAGQPSVSKPWAVASLNGKIECAKKLGQNDKAAQLEKQLDPWRDLLLEKSDSGNSIISSATPLTPVAKPVSSDTTNAKNDTAKIYTLQIGAFGSKENALVLEKKLKTDFPDVVTQVFSIEDKLFYRVRVGSFKSKESATAFGTDSLTKKGFSFRVMDKGE